MNLLHIPLIFMIRRLFIILISLTIVACGTTGQHQRTKTTYKKPPANVSVGAGPNREVATYAMKFLGTPYYFGGSSPSQGFDCSGLTQYSAKSALGVNMPRVTAQQSQFGQKISIDELKAGDLIFFNISSQPNSHVGIYIGDTFFVHAPSSGGVVRVDSLTNSYWQPRINIARRIQ